MNKLNVIVAAAVLSAALTACNQVKTSETAQQAPQDSVKTEKVNVDLKDSALGAVYSSYNNLNSALIKSDNKAAQKEAAVLADRLKTVDGCENTARIAQKIAASSNISKQREDYSLLSSDLIALFKNAEITSGTLYVDYCPMANDGKGAYWLASNSEINNPYFGDEMLNCGEVKEKIKKK